MRGCIHICLCLCVRAVRLLVHTGSGRSKYSDMETFGGVVRRLPRNAFGPIDGRQREAEDTAWDITFAVWQLGMVWHRVASRVMFSAPVWPSFGSFEYQGVLKP